MLRWYRGPCVARVPMPGAVVRGGLRRTVQDAPWPRQSGGEFCYGRLHTDIRKHDDRMINNDFGWAAKNKDRLVAEWRKRYDGKTEPKS